jgi:hypothetical protein
MLREIPVYVRTDDGRRQIGVADETDLDGLTALLDRWGLNGGGESDFAGQFFINRVSAGFEIIEVTE